MSGKREGALFPGFKIVTKIRLSSRGLCSHEELAFRICFLTNLNSIGLVYGIFVAVAAVCVPKRPESDTARDWRLGASNTYIYMFHCVNNINYKV